MPAGIVGGPVKLVDTNGSTIDLFDSSWSYKVTQNMSAKLMLIV